MDITPPLRLVKDSHQAGSARPLAILVQEINDHICHHGMLCPDCSQVVLHLGHQTVGTGNYTHDQLRLWLEELIDSPVWGSSRLANTNATASVIAIATAAASYAADAADAASAYADDIAIHAAAYAAAAYAANAANAAYIALAADGASAVVNDAYAGAVAIHAADVDAVNAYINTRLWHARHAIDAWHRICGTSPHPISEETTIHAIRQMQETR